MEQKDKYNEKAFTYVVDTENYIEVDGEYISREIYNKAEEKFNEFVAEKKIPVFKTKEELELEEKQKQYESNSEQKFNYDDMING